MGRLVVDRYISLLQHYLWGTSAPIRARLSTRVVPRGGYPRYPRIWLLRSRIWLLCSMPDQDHMSYTSRKTAPERAAILQMEFIRSCLFQKDRMKADVYSHNTEERRIRKLCVLFRSQTLGSLASMVWRNVRDYFFLVLAFARMITESEILGLLLT